MINRFKELKISHKILMVLIAISTILSLLVGDFHMFITEGLLLALYLELLEVIDFGFKGGKSVLDIFNKK